MPTLDCRTLERPVIDRQLFERLVVAVARRIIAASDTLSELDRTIGDGDHGINMRRGMEAVLAGREMVLDLAFGQALQAIGHQIVGSVGGASGPLVATWFLTLGRNWPQSGTDLPIDAFEAALQAVKARGRSDVGQKTLIDVLAPVTEAIKSGLACRELGGLANRAAEATKPMLATRGRAAFLGDRSIGHMDPGACSVALMIETAAGLLAKAEERMA
ncbi:MAG: dihydroxyacetone kinase subunit DhaL [Ancalomicrobiaceae bacterium]|nr:dihydroxyacetone kinase subunit DhaL [Ancalomicrobiaceae bacterium]